MRLSFVPQLGALSLAVLLPGLAASCAKDDSAAPSGAAPSASASTSSSTPTPTPTASSTAWHVAGGHMRDEAGRAVILRGANVAGQAKSAPYLPFQQPEDFARMHDAWGFDSVRYLVLWAGIEPQMGQYDEAYLDAVAQRIDWAAAAGLMVILDMHEDVYGEGFGGDGAPLWTCDAARYAAFKPQDPWFLNNLDPNVEACVDGFYASDELRGHYVEAWRRLAAKLKDRPAVIGFDPMNEPGWGSASTATFEAEKLAPLYVQITNAVRGEAKSWLAFLEPSASRNIGIATHLPPMLVSDVVYSPHAYDSSAEQGKGFTATSRALMLKKLQDYRDEATTMGAALWIGEYGGVSTLPGIADYMDADYAAAGSVGASTAYWTYDRGEGYGLLHTDGSEKTELLALLVRPYPERVAGDPTSYAFDAGTRVFTLAYHASGAAEPTELVVPDRVYPEGFHVDCGGCTVEKTAGRAALRGIPAGDVTVTVAPGPLVVWPIRAARAG